MAECLAILAGCLLLAAAADDDHPPQLCGYAVLEVCGRDSNSPYSRWLAVAPGAVTVLTDPPTAPVRCIRIYTDGGQMIYVTGTYQDVAARLWQATRERLDGCPP